MQTKNLLRAFALAIALTSSGWGSAQTTASGGTVLVIPVVAETATFSSEVTVRNFNNAAMTLNVRFYEANTSSVPGQRTCAQLALNAQESKQFALSAQCTLGAGSHHGMLILENAAAEKLLAFRAYSRTQNFAASGFSVEAFPIGNFSSAGAGAVGLKRTAAAPTYQTNCFVAALGETVNYRIRLTEPSAAAQIGGDITGTLAPYQMVRILDVFAAAGLPAGDYQNVRASFDDTDSGEPSFVGFCTVQDSVSFGADFRIATSTEGADNSQRRYVCYGQNPCGTIDPVTPTQLTDTTLKLIHWLFIRAPDYVKCELISPRLADLEIRLRGPGDPFLAPVFPSSPPYSSGGNNQTFFYIYTGARGTVNDGFATRWFIDVSFREGANATVPIPYGIDCFSGNGVSVPWVRASAADDF